MTCRMSRALNLIATKMEGLTDQERYTAIKAARDLDTTIMSLGLEPARGSGAFMFARTVYCKHRDRLLSAIGGDWCDPVK
jgi:hypothetical protein